MRILITTLGRVDRQVTLANLPLSIRMKTALVVQAHEYDAHAKAFPTQEIISLPDHIRCIGDTRHHLARERFPQEKILLLDDDLTFYIRRDFPDWHMKVPYADEIYRMFNEVEQKLDTYAHVGVSGREGNNRVSEYGVENTRFMRMVGYNTAMFPDPFVCNRVDCMSDFDTNLQLLNLGLPSYTFYVFAQGQPATQTDGGCSLIRTHDTHSAEVRKMCEMWGNVVKARVKHNKTGGEFGVREELTIFWKKAFKGKTLMPVGGIEDETGDQEEYPE